MIEQQGTVIAVTAGLASVRIGAVAGCPACDAGRGCGAGLFGRLLRRQPVMLRILNRIGADPGQSVVIGIPESVFLKLVSQLYLLPLLAGFAGATLAYVLASTVQASAGVTDACTLLGGVAASAFALWRLRSVSPDFRLKLNPELLRVVSPGSDSTGPCLPPADTACNS